MCLALEVCLDVFGEPCRLVWDREPVVRRRDLVIHLLYPGRQHRLLALVEFERDAIVVLVDGAPVPPPPAAEVGAHYLIPVPDGL